MGVKAAKIFVNLPVKDLNKSVDFFTKVGFEFDAQFTDENATCMVVSEHIFVMLLVEDFLKPLRINKFPMQQKAQRLL